jgi:hypothetical protein
MPPLASPTPIAVSSMVLGAWLAGGLNSNSRNCFRPRLSLELTVPCRVFVMAAISL